MTLATELAAALRVDCCAAPSFSCAPKAVLLISPRFLLPTGRSLGVETAPVAKTDECVCGVDGTGELYAAGPSSWCDRDGVETAPAAAEPSAGRKLTRIFFSCILPFAVCSMFAH